MPFHTNHCLARRQQEFAAAGLSWDDIERLSALTSPEAVQDFVDAIPMNFDDDTCWSVREVLRRQVAMCIEGALVAAAALSLQGRPPLLMRVFAIAGDVDHAVTLFLHKGRWGAISKSNHLWCRWRDPVYRSVRELAMSYLHEYVTGPDKTMRAFGAPFDLRRQPLSSWLTQPGSCRTIDRRFGEWDYQPLLDDGPACLRPRDALELRGGTLVQFEAPAHHTAIV